MAEAIYPGAHKKSPEVGRRGFVKAGIGSLVVASIGGVGYALRGNGEKEVTSVKPPSVNNGDVAPPESGAVFNGQTQNPDLYPEGRLNPADFMNMTEPQRAEVMTLLVEGLKHDDLATATEYVRIWELFTNLACVPQEAQEAIDEGGYVLRELKDEPSVLSLNKDFAKRRNDKYGNTIEHLTNSSYEGHDFSYEASAIQGYADVTSHNFGLHISAPPEQYGATADTTTSIGVDSVSELVSTDDLAADRMLDIGVTMTFVGPYKDEVLKGNVHLLLNEDGEKYDTTVSWIQLLEQE